MDLSKLSKKFIITFVIAIALFVTSIVNLIATKTVKNSTGESKTAKANAYNSSVLIFIYSLISFIIVLAGLYMEIKGTA